MATIAEQLAGLDGLQPARLRAEWQRLHRSRAMPEGMSFDLMARGVAWRLQEKDAGGLPPLRVRELDRLAKQLEAGGELDLERNRQLKPGARLVRQWHDRVYTVTVLEQGYEFQDRHYTSLTPIARHITGAAWSGPRFFGLTDRKSVVRHEPEV